LSIEKPFQFKRFAVSQSGCAMKVNTDGVLLGALAGRKSPAAILDVGTGTGVIALMLAQRFKNAVIDAVEIETSAAIAAQKNFSGSSFKDRLNLFSESFQEYSKKHPLKKYDLIASNPPFFLNSLKNQDKLKETARHAGSNFFPDLIDFGVKHLASQESCMMLILPPETAAVVIAEGEKYGLKLQGQTHIHSFPDQPPYRSIIALGFGIKYVEENAVVIYKSQKQYSEQYKHLLKDFLTIF